MAEINVPAWPIPIHQTKLTIANPQAIGTFIPQIPIPRTSKYASANIITMKPIKPTPNMTNHSSGVLRVSTTPLIFP